MNFKKISVSVLAVTALAMSVFAAVEDLPVKSVNGKKYHYYTVQPKESLYSLSHKLGISRQEIIKYNPGVEDGLKAYEDLLFPYTPKGETTYTPTSEAVEDVVANSYVVKKGDTVYGLCRRFGISRDEFVALNPGAVDGLKAGETVRLRREGSVPSKSVAASETKERIAATHNNVSHSSSQSLSQSQTAGKEHTYTIKEGETLYHISKEHGTTVEAILSANPELDVTDYKMGMVIVIPSDTAENQEIAPAETIGFNPNANAQPQEDTAQETVVPVENEKIVVAVALPFNLNVEKADRQDKVYTEFYKGFLLAVDSMRNCGTPIKLMAFDTADNMDSVRKILANPILEEAQVIIAPGDMTQLNAFANYGKQHGIKVLNLFHVKDISYRINPSVMQGNIPHGNMYDKAADYLVNNLRGATPVIIKSRNAASDKAEFLTALKGKMDERGMTALEIVFDDQLKADDLERLEGTGAFTFIPVTGKSDELQRILPALIEFKKSSINPDEVKLFGYPEWTTFRGDMSAKMLEMGTTVFSRFYTVPEDEKLKQVEDVFVRWYGAPMASLVPRQGLFGFDTGMYLINALKANGGDFSKFTPTYNGVQNGFDFQRSEGGGYVNNDLYIINFRTDGSVDKELL